MKTTGWKLLTPRRHRQLHDALDRAYAHEHELVQQVETLRIERNHYRDDSLLIGLVAAYLIDKHEGDDFGAPVEEVNAFLGRSINAFTEEGYVFVTVGDRLEASEEGKRG